MIVRSAVLALAVACVCGASTLSRLPLIFEPDSPSDPTRFTVQRPGYSLQVDRNGGTIHSPTGTVQMRFAGARSSSMEGLEPGGRVNYLFGNRPSAWKFGIPAYGKVRLVDLYPGVDAVFYGRDSELEYDLVLAPGANPRAIRLEFPGSSGLNVDWQGALRVSTSSGTVLLRRPVVYQQTVSGRRAVDAAYRILAGKRVGIRVGRYDTRRPLVIDPVLEFATYLGGQESNYSEGIHGVALDPEGNIVVAGNTTAADFPGTTGTVGPTYPKAQSAFVAKLNADGTKLLWAAYLNGTQSDGTLNSAAQGIAVDSSGRIYAAGSTTATDFPVKTSGLFRTARGGLEGWVACLDPNGTSLDYSLYLSGWGPDAVMSIAVDASGSALVTGYTESPNFPTMKPLQQANGGGRDGFIAKIASDGASLVYSSYLGGGSSDSAYAIAAAPDGSAHVTGYTESGEFPVVGGFQNRLSGPALASLSSNGGSTWTTPDSLPFTAAIGCWLVPSKDPESIWVGTLGQGVFKSTDGGQTWQERNRGLGHLKINVLAAHPSNPLVLYAGTGQSLYQTQDGGATWIEMPVGLDLSDVTAFAIHPMYPAQMWVAFRQGKPPVTTVNLGDPCGGFFASTDGGNSWGEQHGVMGGTNILIANQCISSFLVFPGYTKLVWALEPDYGLMRFNTSTSRWDYISPQVSGINSAVIDPNNPNVLYLSSSNAGILKTTDGGSNWISANKGLIDAPTGIANTASDSSTLYLATAGGVYATSDSASTWNLVRADTAVGNVATDPSNAKRVFAGAEFSTDTFAVIANPDGSALTYSTFLGGAKSDWAQAVALDQAGNFYVGGDTNSDDLPVTASAAQSKLIGAYDGFIARINPDGGLGYLSYVGGSDDEDVSALQAGDGGIVFAAGATASKDFPTTPDAIQPTLNGAFSAFLHRTDTNSGQVIGSTLLGGTAYEQATALATDASGSAIIAGHTTSTDFPGTSSGAQATLAGYMDGFVAKIGGFGPNLTLPPGPLALTFDPGSDAPAGTIDIDNPAGPVDFTAEAQEFWLDVSPASGTTPATLTVTTDPAGLPPALYTGHIAITEQPNGGRATATVRLNVNGMNPIDVRNAASLEIARAAPGSLVYLETTKITTAGEFTVLMTDSTGKDSTLAVVSRTAGRMAIVVPADVPPGSVWVSVMPAEGATVTDMFQAAPLAPGLFSASGNAKGPARASLLTAGEDGEVVRQPTFQCSTGGRCANIPINGDTSAGPVVLEFRATGLAGYGELSAVAVNIGGQSAELVSISPAADSPGVDLVAVRLPPELSGAGQLDVVVSAGDSTSNTVTIHIQ